MNKDEDDANYSVIKLRLPLDLLSNNDRYFYVTIRGVTCLIESYILTPFQPLEIVQVPVENIKIPVVYKIPEDNNDAESDIFGEKITFPPPFDGKEKKWHKAPGSTDVVLINAKKWCALRYSHIKKGDIVHISPPNEDQITGIVASKELKYLVLKTTKGDKKIDRILFSSTKADCSTQLVRSEKVYDVYTQRIFANTLKFGMTNESRDILLLSVMEDLNFSFNMIRYQQQVNQMTASTHVDDDDD